MWAASERSLCQILYELLQGQCSSARRCVLWKCNCKWYSWERRECQCKWQSWERRERTEGKTKTTAGERSGVRRSAKQALVVKKKWLDLILVGRKTWEIRGTSTAKRGWIHFAESQAGGKLMGRARLVKCLRISKKSFMRHYKQHCVPSLSMVPYDTPYAWVLEDVERFKSPFDYEHKQGAVIWVDV